jgi:hypothetical protein
MGPAAQAGPAAQIWLAGEDPVVQADKHKSQAADYMDLFKHDSPWRQTMSRLTALKVSSQFILRGSDEQLKAVFAGLKERHIGLAIEFGVVDPSAINPGPGDCGFHVEGYSLSGSTENIARRIKTLGGRLDYAAMDEPVWFGHFAGQLSGGRKGCQYSLAELADQAAKRIDVFRQYFPDIQVGDIEPINAKTGGPQSIEAFAQFEQLLRQKTGTAPAFVHADIGWAIPGWQGLMRTLAARSRAQSVPLGVICDGDANAGGNEAWVRQALERCQSVAADPSIVPDVFIAQSWEPLPTKMLPETDPGALTFEAARLSELAHRARAQE